MNILPKKSWHVRTKKNIEKVRRDEAQAAEEEKRKLERAALAEREARIKLLRKRARGEDADDDDGNETTDIFDGIKRGQGNERVNKEREFEERRKKREWEEKVGILKYLHKEAKIDVPWYTKSHEERMGLNVERQVNDNERLREDPLNDMDKLSAQSQGKHDEMDRRKSKKELGNKRPHIPWGKETSSSSHQQTPVDPNEKLNKLREERLKREMKEQIRQSELLANKARTSRSVEAPMSDERTRRYNSQFNPQLAKQSASGGRS